MKGNFGDSLELRKLGYDLDNTLVGVPVALIEVLPSHIIDLHKNRSMKSEVEFLAFILGITKKGVLGEKEKVLDASVH